MNIIIHQNKIRAIIKFGVLAFINSFLFIGIIYSQNKNSSTILTDSSMRKPEIFSSGFIDVVNSGQINASARFIRLYIGEPGKFAIPLSVYSGVSSNSFQNTNTTTIINKSNDQLYNNFINPLSGLANIAVNGVIFVKKHPTKLTRVGIIYHAGERVLTGFKSGLLNNPQTGKPINFLSSIMATGLYFQTGAWETSNDKNVGVLWLTFRYLVSYTNPTNLKEILPNINTTGLYKGYCIGWGVEINNLVNIKVLYYKYIKAPEIDYGLLVYQFSFNYTMNNK